MSDYKLLIGGRLVPGAMTLNVINPATEGVLAMAPRADCAQLEEAVAAAKAAFPAWSATPIRERGALLARLADAMEARQGEFARLLTEEQGKPLAAAMHEMDAAIARIRYFATLDLLPRVLREDATRRIVQERMPLGVVAAITPWNVPVLLLAQKIAPALLAGNTVVAKPAPTTPLTTLKVGELCAQILPPGVINIIVDQNDLGGALTSHPDVAKVTFTGSTATGKKVMESVVSTLKRLTLELGGNDAAIVLDDVDPKEVAPKLLAGALFNCGQGCIAIKRLYVHESQYDEICDELGRLARKIIIDDGLKQGTQMGPLQNKAQFEKVKDFLKSASESGKIIAGGNALPRKGYFIQPTIVRDIDDDARLVKEEQFGPILPVLRYSDVDDAIARANDTDYGLGGSVWSNDLARAAAVAAKVVSGTVWINQHLDMHPDIPFRGAKQSGIGTEQGQEGLEEYTQARIVNMAKARA
ncbi:aldehyde dehydrogenase family protein [Hypericibacter sp.]|uniref:aldehyde dehydrogenase family protein n=1 Tax=Hypericibacter sp. TaxID=2705401 RepID=UPI003D6D32BC